MQYRRLGRTGLPVSAIALGTAGSFGAGIERGVARSLLADAWDAGINLFDSAEQHAEGRGQQVLGDVIADMRLPRDGYALLARIGQGTQARPLPMQRGLSAKHVRDACEAALRRLRSDYLDLLICDGADAEVPLLQTMAAIQRLQQQGKLLHWGVSGWTQQQIARACQLADAHGLPAPQLRCVDATEPDAGSSLSAAAAGTESVLLAPPLRFAAGKVELAETQADWLPPATPSDTPDVTAVIAACLRHPAVASVSVTPFDADQLRQALAAIDQLA